MAFAAIAHGCFAAMDARRKRIDRAHSAIVDRRQHGQLVGPGAGTGGKREIVRWRIVTRYCLYRTALGRPFTKAAVKNRDIVKAGAAQHPPEPCRPHGRCRGVGDDARSVSDTRRSERLRQPVDGRHGEGQPRGAVGQLVDQIDERRARNMSGIIVGASALDRIWSRRCRPQVNGRVEDPQVPIMEMRLQPIGRYKTSAIPLGHDLLPVRKLGNSALHCLMRKAIHAIQPRR